jgi:hypothetical protein
MRFPLATALLLSLLPAVFAAFGVTRSGSNYIVDSGAGLLTTSKESVSPILESP